MKKGNPPLSALLKAVFLFGGFPFLVRRMTMRKKFKILLPLGILLGMGIVITTLNLKFHNLENNTPATFLERYGGYAEAADHLLSGTIDQANNLGFHGEGNARGRIIYKGSNGAEISVAFLGTGIVGSYFDDLKVAVSNYEDPSSRQLFEVILEEYGFDPKDGRFIELINGISDSKAINETESNGYRVVAMHQRPNTDQISLNTTFSIQEL